MHKEVTRVGRPCKHSLFPVFLCALSCFSSAPSASTPLLPATGRLSWRRPKGQIYLTRSSFGSCIAFGGLPRDCFSILLPRIASAFSTNRFREPDHPQKRRQAAAGTISDRLLALGETRSTGQPSRGPVVGEEEPTPTMADPAATPPLTARLDLRHLKRERDKRSPREFDLGGAVCIIATGVPTELR